MEQALQFIYHTKKTSDELSEILLGYINELKNIADQDSGEYLSHEHLIRLPRDSKIFIDAQSVADIYKTDHLKYIVVIGIGGSNLGAKAVYEALRGQLDYLDGEYPEMLFADTISGQLLSDMIALFERTLTSSDQIVLNLVSKSGETTESIVNFELLYHALLQRFPNIATRVVVTTDFGSKLWKESERLLFRTLLIPKEVGGRYSIFSSVGIFPLLLAGIDVTALRIGASKMLSLCVGEDVEGNHALQSALAMYDAMKDGATMQNIFLFNPEMESLGKWERQLIGESMGKEKDVAGNVIHAGITPIVSIGSTDLHSMAQLYFGGPKDKFTMLVYAPMGDSLHLQEEGIFHGLVEGLHGKTPNDVMQAIIGGVRAAYEKNSLPFMEVQFEKLSERSIGAYLMWRMVTVMYLAKLLHVNAFDQPNVEDYKETTRQLLLGQV